MRRVSLTVGLSGFLALAAAGAAAGEPAGRAETGAQVALSPTRYELDVAVDYQAEALRATARIELENPSSAPVGSASLLLYRLLRVEGVRDGGGRDLAFRQDVVVFEDYRAWQVNQVLVTLAEPLAPRARTTIQLRYEGPLLGYAETFRYVRDRIAPDFTILRDDALAYPIPGYPSVAARRRGPVWSFTYAARITVPRRFVVANGGRLDRVDAAGETRTFHYSSLLPSWRMDFAIAEYKELSLPGLHIFHLPGDEAGAAPVAEAASQAVSLLAAWHGPRRETAVLTFIEIPDGWGSQTDVSSIIQTAAAFRDPRKMREVYHEISHLWNVPSTERPSPRWEEGLASFLEYLLAQEISGEPAVDARAALLIERLKHAAASRPELRTVPLVQYGASGMTDWSYTVGGLFFDLLYRIAGKDVFHTVIRRYYDEAAGRGGSTTGLAAVIERNAPMNLSPLIEDWLLTTAWTRKLEQASGIEALADQYRPQHRAPGGDRAGREASGRPPGGVTVR